MIYLTTQELAFLLGVSDRWLEQRLERADSELSTHLKAGANSRAPVRFDSHNIALYLLQHTKDHRLADFPSTTPATEAIQQLEQRIRDYVFWYRSCRPQAPSHVIRDAILAESVEPDIVEKILTRIKHRPEVTNAWS